MSRPRIGLSRSTGRDARRSDRRSRGSPTAAGSPSTSVRTAHSLLKCPRVSGCRCVPARYVTSGGRDVSEACLDRLSRGKRGSEELDEALDGVGGSVVVEVLVVDVEEVVAGALIQEPLPCFVAALGFVDRRGVDQVVFVSVQPEDRHGQRPQEVGYLDLAFLIAGERRVADG